MQSTTSKSKFLCWATVFVLAVVSMGCMVFLSREATRPKTVSAIITPVETATTTTERTDPEITTTSNRISDSSTVRSHHRLQFLNKTTQVLDLVGKTPRNAAALCELMLLGNPRCRIAQGEEDMFECIIRYGVTAWTAALQPQCTRSEFWRKMVETYAAQDKGEYASRYFLLYDPVMQWHLAPVIAELRRRERRTDVVITRRTPPPPTAAAARDDDGNLDALLHPPLNCSYGPIYPFGFCAPQESLVPELANSVKVFDWFPILPSYVPYYEEKKISKVLGYRPRYVMSAIDEHLMTVLYRLSYFSWTHRRMGADCMRHYEILSAGSVPMFPDLYLLPEAWLSHLPPRRLLRSAFSLLPGVDHIGEIQPPEGRVSNEYYYRTFAKQMNFKREGTIRWDRFNESAYRAFAAHLFQFTSQHVVCRAMMRYALKKVGFVDPAQWETLRVLLITLPTVDYQASSVEHGLYELGIPYTVNVVGEQHHDANETIAMMERLRGGKTPLTLDAMMTGSEYDMWRDHHRLHNFYGQNFMVGRRIPVPAAVLQGPAMCTAIEEGQFDLIVYTTVKEVATSGGELACERHAANSTRRQVANRTRVAVFDGEDSPAVKNYARWAQRGFTMFSREAHC